MFKQRQGKLGGRNLIWRSEDVFLRKFGDANVNSLRVVAFAATAAEWKTRQTSDGRLNFDRIAIFRFGKCEIEEDDAKEHRRHEHKKVGERGADRIDERQIDGENERATENAACAKSRSRLLAQPTSTFA